jgi:Protein of unknown function (DUF3738)
MRKAIVPVVICSSIITISVATYFYRPLLYERTPERHIAVWRSMTRKYVIVPRYVPTYVREVTGDLPFIFRVVNGLDNPRLVVESNSRQFYTIRYEIGDKRALSDIAKAVGCVSRTELREVDVLEVDLSNEDQKALSRASGKNKTPILETASIGNQWRLDGYSMGDIAVFLERRLRLPVIDNTGLRGEWNVLLRDGFENDKGQPLNGTGLELKKVRRKTELIVIAAE